MLRILQPSKAKKIWQDAKSGNVKGLTKRLQEATAADLCIVKEHGDCLYQPLGIAAKEGHIEIVRMLIAAGIEINFKDSQRGWAALHWASINGNTTVAQVLLDAGADVNIQNKDGRTALHWASFFADTNTVKVLLDAGADVNILDNMGLTALQFASGSSHTDTVQALLDAGANADIQSNGNKHVADQNTKKEELQPLISSHAPTSSPSAHSNNNSSRISWLAVHLVARGMAPGQVAACASAFIEAEGFTTEASLALLPPEEFTLQYLRSVGISGKGTAMQLIALHRELHAQNETSPAAPLPHLSLLKALLLDLVLIVIALSL